MAKPRKIEVVSPDPVEFPDEDPVSLEEINKLIRQRERMTADIYRNVGTILLSIADYYDRKSKEVL